jgi:hypothetical protein
MDRRVEEEIKKIGKVDGEIRDLRKVQGHRQN